MSAGGDEASELRRRKKGSDVVDGEPSTTTPLSSPGKAEPTSSLADSCRSCCYCTSATFVLILALLLYWMVPTFISQAYLDTEENIRIRYVAGTTNLRRLYLDLQLTTLGLPLPPPPNQVETPQRAAQSRKQHCWRSIRVQAKGCEEGPANLARAGLYERCRGRVLDPSI